jgi:hypothetical protein
VPRSEPNRYLPISALAADGSTNMAAGSALNKVFVLISRTFEGR